jgi:hypothetical protein
VPKNCLDPRWQEWAERPGSRREKSDPPEAGALGGCPSLKKSFSGDVNSALGGAGPD